MNIVDITKYLDAQIFEDKSVIHFGSGSGDLCSYFGKKGAYVIGIEKNSDLIKLAKRTYLTPTFIQADIDALDASNLLSNRGLKGFNLVLALGVWNKVNKLHFAQLIKDICLDCLYFSRKGENMEIESILLNEIGVKSIKFLGSLKDDNLLYKCGMR